MIILHLSLSQGQVLRLSKVLQAAENAGASLMRPGDDQEQHEVSTPITRESLEQSIQLVEFFNDQKKETLNQTKTPLSVVSMINL